MNGSHLKLGLIVCGSCIVGAAMGVALFGGSRWHPKPALAPRSIDLSPLDPGGRMSLTAGGRHIELSIPPGEGFTYGTFHMDISGTGGESSLMERDGSLETAWIADVNGDATEDVILIVRSGGSGSYVDIVVLASGAGGYAIRRLPPVSSSTMAGYMGHDTVSIRKNVIVRSFPTYASKSGIRIDRQWRPDDGLRGEAPIRVDPDSNADPSGATRELYYDFASGRWHG